MVTCGASTGASTKGSGAPTKGVAVALADARGERSQGEVPMVGLLEAPLASREATGSVPVSVHQPGSSWLRRANLGL